MPYRIALLITKVKTAQSELRKMADIVDELLAAMQAMWQRTCPQCGRVLLKEDPMRPLRCACGWEWA